jgi:hypothetical protein
MVVLALFIWFMGGHVTALRSLWGVQGERFTADEIEKLSVVQVRDPEQRT